MTTMYRLKPGQDSIDIVDGPHAGARFRRELAYTADQIPDSERRRFEAVLAGQGGDDPQQAARDEANKQTATSRKQAASGSRAGDKTGGTKK